MLGRRVFFIRDASYVLLEGCYAWGSSRYQFESYMSDHIIFRNCVGRPDDINAGTDPAAVFSAYTSTYVKFQNCIAIDGDQIDSWSGINVYAGAFAVPTTAGASTNVDFDQCVGLNTYLGGILVASNGPTSNINFNNIVLWDMDNSGAWMLGFRNPAIGSNFTIGESTFSQSYCDGSSTALTNSIFYENTVAYMWSDAPTTDDYNAYYGNTDVRGRTGTHDLLTTDPSDGSLEYLPRIELGSDLSGAGANGVDIGANVLTLIGISGSLWGEAGYDEDTGVSMWPFPNEDLIKTQMAAYSSGDVTGARGFAATGTQLNGTDEITLTSYIWEYLGNQMPADIYADYQEDAPASDGNLLPAVNLRLD